MKYKLVFSKQVERAFKRLNKLKNFDMERFHFVLNTLLKDEILPISYKDHKLKGDLADFRECHIYPDLLLIYQKQEDIMILYLFRLGNHSNLF